MGKIMKFVVVEESDIIREGIVSVLKKINESFRIFSLSEYSQLVGYLQKESPDAVLLDPAIMMPKPFRDWRAEWNLTDVCCVALVSSFKGMRYMQDFDMYITLSDDFERIREKILRLSPEKETPDTKKALSQREKEIVTYIAKGYTNKQIADELCLSSHTVITHRRNIAAKLQIHSSAGMTIYAVANKLVKLEDIED